MKPSRLESTSLSAQVILSLIALVLLTAIAVGVPALWLIHAQLERQAWTQVEQGGLVTRALFSTAQKDLENLATLTAQRPTLYELLANGQHDRLAAYLSTLREGSGLDLVVICDLERQITVQSGAIVTDWPCEEGGPLGFRVAPDQMPMQVWLLAVHPVAHGEGRFLGTVIVGQALDDTFANELRQKTGLEHTLLVEGEAVATTLLSRTGLAPWDDLRTSAAPHDPRGKFSLDGHRYYASRYAVNGSGLLSEVALDVSEILSARRRAVWALVGSMAGVAVLASLFGALLARRIGDPLVGLADAAGAMSRGDLATPLSVEARVREIALVAQALEGARSDLQTTLEELRLEKAWSEHLLEAIVEGIVTLDRRGQITFFSQGAERISGWKRTEVLGRSCDYAFRTVQGSPPFSQTLPPPGQQRKISVELQGGREAILAVTGARLVPPEGKGARVALVFRDISEEEAVHRLLGHFLANVAHEFRTPLSALAASVELLLDEAPDLTSDELEELLASVHLGVLGLQTLIDNLLESASIEAGHFRVSPRLANVGDILGEAIRTMQPLLNRRGQRLIVELPALIPEVRADPRRMVQVLVNLLSNASKFGPDDAEIQVSVQLHAGQVRVAVADSGPGVPSEHRGELFRRFVHPHSGNDKAPVGVGLGLSVVKAVVEAHGGQVGVGDRPGGGAVFWLTIPTAASSA